MIGVVEELLESRAGDLGAKTAVLKALGKRT
jgi:hypothetical protein